MTTFSKQIHKALVAAGAGVLATAMALTPGITFAADAQTNYYSSKQPYPVPSQETTSSYSAAPAGYEPIYTESVDRHGSRGLSSYKYDALLKLMATTAAKENGFKSEQVKNEFLASLDGITAANVKNGYGQLTNLGRDELRGIGQRAYDRNKTLFDQANANGEQIAFESSGESRATESGDRFKDGLVNESGNALADNVQANEKRPGILYFHKLENPDGTVKQPGDEGYAEAKAYEDWLDAQESDNGQITAHMDFIESLPESKTVANDLLKTIFTDDFISKIGTDDAHIWYNTKDGTKKGEQNCAPGADPAKDADACGEASKKIKTQVDAAEYVYELYITQADMTEENNGTFDFTKYFAGHEQDAEWFAYLLDKDDFYEKGPGFEGHDDSYKNAQVLLDDFFKVIDQRVDGGSTAATFRFGHAETVVPFAALLKLPGSTQQAPDVAQPKSIHDVFNYTDNIYRSDTVGPMAVNVQWDVVARKGTDPKTGKAYTPLVRVLYNEKETALDGAQCVPVAKNSTWYKLSELKRCLKATGYVSTGEDPQIDPNDVPTPNNPDANKPSQYGVDNLSAVTANYADNGAQVKGFDYRQHGPFAIESGRSVKLQGVPDKWTAAKTDESNGAQKFTVTSPDGSFSWTYEFSPNAGGAGKDNGTNGAQKTTANVTTTKNAGTPSALSKTGVNVAVVAGALVVMMAVGLCLIVRAMRRD